MHVLYAVDASVDSEQVEEKRPRVEEPGNFQPVSSAEAERANISMRHCPTEEPPPPKDEIAAMEEKEPKEEVYLLLLYSYHPFTVQFHT